MALYDASDNQYQLLRVLGNTLARGDSHSPEALTVSPDGKHVAFVGPTDFTISVVNARSLDEVSIDTNQSFTSVCSYCLVLF